MVRHPIHLLDISPWPIAISFSLGFTGFSLASGLHSLSHTGLLFSIPCVLLIMILWFRDVLREGTAGKHTILVQSGISFGFILFLLSEVMLFFSFFWAYFHSALSPVSNLGGIWPPVAIDAIDPWAIPLFGSIILLSSGFTVTLAHHSLRSADKDTTFIGLLFTVLLGLVFVCLQAYEYSTGSFTIADSVFGSVFFMTTGLHGSHVIIGVIFLTVSMIRLMLNSYTSEHHVGIESAIFYWHLVDLVWFFVFTTYYWWGS